MKHKSIKNCFGYSVFMILAMMGFSAPCMAQSWDNATLLAYDSTQNKSDDTADDDIMLAMKALEEASAVIEPAKATDDVDIDSILFAAAINAEPAKQPAVETPVSQPEPAPKADPQEVQPTAVAQVQESTPKPVDAKPMAAPETTKPQQQQVVAAAPADTNKPQVVSAPAKPQQVAAAAPADNSKHQVVSAPAKPQQVAAAAPADNSKHQVVSAPAKPQQVAAAAPADTNKHQVVSAPAKPQQVATKPATAPKTPDSASQVAKSTTPSAKPASGNASDIPAVTPSALAMQYVMAVYAVNNVDLKKTVNGRTPTIGELYQYAFKQKLVYHNPKPAIGDLAFFHNAYDRNQDGRWNDWHTQIGIVESIDENSTISILVWQDNKIQRIYLNLKYPELHKNKKGAVLNTQLRPDENGQRGTAAKLFGGFANLLGSATKVTVIDNWVPGMKIDVSNLK